MKSDQRDDRIYDLAQAHPHWAMRALERLSLKRALKMLRTRRAQHVARAKTIVGAITTLQDYKKAKRDFAGIVLFCPVIAALHITSGSLLTGTLWLGVGPLMALNWHKAYRAKAQAEATIDFYSREQA